MSTIAPPAPPAPPGPPPASPDPVEGWRSDGASATELDDRTPSAARRMPPWLIDGFAVAALGALSLWGFVPSFGPMGWVVGMVGLLAATAWATLTATKAWSTWLAVLGGILVYIVVGSVMVVPDRALAGIVPTANSTVALLKGVVFGWSSAVVSRPPIGRLDNLLAVPLVCGVLVGVLCPVLARRAGRVVFLSVVPPLAVLVGATLIGTDDEVSVVQGSLFAVVAVWWLALAQRRSRSRDLQTVRDGAQVIRLVGLLAVALVVGTLIGGTSFVSGSGHRVVLRNRVTPPVDERLQESPLAQFRHFRLDLANTPLFTVSGLRAGDRIRLAVLDYYDGLTWQTTPSNIATGSASTYERVGSQLPVASDTGPTRTISVTVDHYQGVWIPSVENPTSITFDGGQQQALADGLRYDVSNGTLADPNGLSAGDVFNMTVEHLSGVTPNQAAVVIPRGLAKLLSTSSVTTEAWRQLTTVSNELSRGLYSDGLPTQSPSDPGESEARLQTLVSQYTTSQGTAAPNTEAGDDEQYTAVLALVARELGLPARIVVGFTPTSGTSTIYGRDVTAWVEVYHQGTGTWQAFFPTPPRSRDQNTPPPLPQTTPLGVPIQPPPASPPAPQSHAKASTAKGSNNNSNCGNSGTCSSGIAIPTWVAPALGIPLGIVGLFVGVTLAIAGIKRARRNRRRNGGTPSSQVAGGWEELCDLVRDTGGILPRNATRRESAVLVARPGVALAAQRTDALVFGPDEVSAEAASSYWRDIDATRAGILASLGRVQRWKATVSLSSLHLQTRIDKGVAKVSSWSEASTTWTREIASEFRSWGSGFGRKVAR